jgi:hypothetical protein
MLVLRKVFRLLTLNKGEDMHGGPRHSTEEVNWALEKTATIQRLEDFTPKAIREKKLLEEYKQRFGKEITIYGLGSWIKALKFPEKYGYQAVKARKEKEGKGKKESKTVDTATVKFIIFINDKKFAVCKSEKEISTLVSNAKPSVLNDMRIFKYVPHKVKYTAKLELGVI